MRIAHVTAGLVRAGAGVREVVQELSRAQMELGQEVCVFGLDHPDWAKERATWQGAHPHVYRVHGPRALGYAPGMVKGLLEFQPDIVHLHGLWMHPGRSVLQWHQCTGLPYIVSVHGMLSTIALSYSPVKKRLVSHFFQDAVFAHATAVHVTSSEEADEVRSYGLRNSLIAFPNGVSALDRPTDLGPEPSKRILSLGRIHRKKALDRLISAWAELEHEFSDWSLDLVGPSDGDEAEKLQVMASNLGLKRVSIRGPLFEEEKIACMAGAEIFALPTLSENFALTVAESLMLEVPVVSSKGAPWSALDHEGCGHWVDHGSGPMADALRRMMRLPPSERREMGARGRKWMLRDFSWPAIANQSLDQYRKLLVQSGSSLQ